jgi:hypothetical protein
MMFKGIASRASPSTSRAIIVGSAIIVLGFLLLYARSWPFPPVLQYPRTIPIEIRGVPNKGSTFGATQIVYGSNGEPVRDIVVRWEVSRLARGFGGATNRASGETLVRGAFVYRPCPRGIGGRLWCRHYEWQWSVPTFLPPPGDSFPLETAVAAGSMHEIRALIRAGANVNARDPLGETAIWSARTPEIAKLLVSAGASVEAPVDGFTSLMGAARAHDLARVQALLAVGADPNARDRAGLTPLLHALHPPLYRQDIPSTALVTELVRAGARVNVGDNKGVTPLMSAVRGGWPDIVRVLLAAHADVNGRDKQGVTALSLARREGQREIVQLLKEAAAPR